jgi:hypothetical protein
VDSLLLQQLIIGESPFATTFVPARQYAMTTVALDREDDGIWACINVGDWLVSFCVHVGKPDSPRFSQQLVSSADPRHETQPTLIRWLTANDMYGWFLGG